LKELLPGLQPPVGVGVGTTVGTCVGITVGLGVGVFVGIAVGITVGIAVGIGVGVAVGVTVGIGIGTEARHPGNCPKWLAIAVILSVENTVVDWDKLGPITVPGVECSAPKLWPTSWAKIRYSPTGYDLETPADRPFQRQVVPR